MTEQQWLNSSHPPGMLGCLRETVSGRKLRLFACGCCLSLWPLLADDRSRRAVDAARRYADGEASREEIEAACQAAAEVADAQTPGTRECAVARAAEYTARAGWPPGVVAGQVASHAAWVANTAPRGRAGREGRAERRKLRAAQAALLRDVVGNPFRPVGLAVAWRPPVVIALARVIYDEGQFGDLPVLADALEEAGCTNADILSHLRGPGPHARGCHILDALMGKE